MTPVEYGKVPEHNQVFLEAGYNEHMERIQEDSDSDLIDNL